MITPERVADEFPKLAGKITGPAVKGVNKALDAWNAGQLTTDELRDMIATLIATANGYARGAAEIIAAAIIADVLGVEPPQPIHKTADGITVESEGDRLTAAAATLLVALDQGTDIRARLTRLAEAEPVAAMQDQIVASYGHHGIDGWFRGLEVDACPLCVDLAGDGRVFPTDITMIHHPGCKCTPIPTTLDDLEEE